jgi:hypothetical protein
MRVHAGCFALFALLSNLSSAAVFSVEQQNAASAHQRLMLWQSTLIASCTGHFSGGGDAAVPFVSYIWRANELKYSLMQDLVWPTVSETEKTSSKTDAEQLQGKLASASPAEQIRICDGLSHTLISPDSHFNRKTPDAAKVLDAMFDSHPELQLKAHKEDMTAGCMIQNFNDGGRVFATAKSICDCKMTALFTQVPEKELKEWFDEIDHKHTDPLTLIDRPSYRHAQPAMLACQPALLK